MTEISRWALDDLRIDKVFIDDGKKTDWGIMRAIANQKRIPVDVIHTGLRGSNVHLIAPDADVTARSVAQLADIVLTYTSTVTVEAAAIGKPVILADGGWHAGRGIATEVHTPSEYGALLEAIISGQHVPLRETELARRYAYALFFRNDIPINHFQSNDFNVAELCLDDWSDLAPGADRSLDAIGRGILFDEPFENPETQHNELAGIGAGMSQP